MKKASKKLTLEFYRFCLEVYPKQILKAELLAFKGTFTSHRDESIYDTGYCDVLSKWEFFIKMRAAFIASILPRVMKEGESKEGSSHFDEKLSIW